MVSHHNHTTIMQDINLPFLSWFPQPTLLLLCVPPQDGGANYMRNWDNSMVATGKATMHEMGGSHCSQHNLPQAKYTTSMCVSEAQGSQ